MVHCPLPRPSLPHRILVPPDCPAQARGIARVVLLLHCLPFGHQVRPCTPATSASRWRPRSPCTFQLRAPGGSGLWRRVCGRCAAVQCLPFALKKSLLRVTPPSPASQELRFVPAAAGWRPWLRRKMALIHPAFRSFVPLCALSSHIFRLQICLESCLKLSASLPPGVPATACILTTFMFSPFLTLHVPRAVP